jgi:tRNA (guanine37-N1)-methyltransferase
MRIDFLTLFPEALAPYLGASILGRAQAARHVEFHLHQLRDYSTDPHKKVDDRPFGGGAGMVMSCQPIVDAVEAIETQDTVQPVRRALRVLLTPQGRVFDQRLAVELSTAERLLLICGHYEGYDERVVEILQPLEISLGDFVLTGGELAALAVADAVTRLLPGVLGNEHGAVDESFAVGGESPAHSGGLEYPQYTRPREYRGLCVPEVLLSGNHAEIERWRRAQSAERTRQRRPDLAGCESGMSAAAGEAGSNASGTAPAAISGNHTTGEHRPMKTFGAFGSPRAASRPPYVSFGSRATSTVRRAPASV